MWIWDFGLPRYPRHCNEKPWLFSGPFGYKSTFGQTSKGWLQVGAKASQVGANLDSAGRAPENDTAAANLGGHQHVAQSMIVGGWHGNNRTLPSRAPQMTCEGLRRDEDNR